MRVRIHGWCLPALWLLFFLSPFNSPGTVVNPLDHWTIQAKLPAYFRSIGFGKGCYVAAGAGGAIWTSTNAVQWTNRSLETNVLLMSVAFGNGIFVISSIEGLIFTSNDSDTWTKRDSGTREQLWAVTFANGRFVAAGFAGASTIPSVITSSTNGVNWEAQTLDTTAPLVSVTYGQGLFVSPGYGVGLTSQDGLNWEANPSGFPGGCHGSAFGNGVFVGTYGTAVLTSSNGFNWSLRNTPASGSLQDMTFLGSNFVTVGEMGTVISSVDGTNWNVRRTELVREALLGVSHDESRFIAVGAEGSIIQSGSTQPSPPLILSEPSDRIVRVGSTYSNQVTVESALLPLHYQWRIDGVPVPDATNDTFIVGHAPLALSGEHSLVVANSAGSVTSAVAHVLVAEPTGIILSPVSQTVPQGGSVTLSVTASGTLPLGFRWRRGGSTIKFVVLNSVQSFLTITNVQDSADYTVAVTNVVSGQGVLSAPARITVLPDSDHDGLPDAWEQANGLNAHNPLDAAFDNDEDGLPNLGEYQAGTDPLNRNSLLLIDHITVAGMVSLEFLAASNKTYSVQFTEALGSGAWNALADLPASSAERTAVVSDPTPSQSRYYRLVTPRQP